MQGWTTLKEGGITLGETFDAAAAGRSLDHHQQRHNQRDGVLIIDGDGNPDGNPAAGASTTTPPRLIILI